MAVPQEHIKLLKQFVQLCQHNPDLLHLPEMSFYTEYLTSLGATIPPPKKARGSSESEKGKEKHTHTHDGEPCSGDHHHQQARPEPEPEPHVESEPEEPEPEFDDDKLVEPDEAEPLPKVDESKEVSEELEIQASEKRSAAQQAFADGKYDEALKLYTEAIELDPHLAMLYAKRARLILSRKKVAAGTGRQLKFANVLLHLKKPNACIRDCEKAISLNPDTAAPYKYRGRAKRLLGRYEEAHHDYSTANKLDYDDQTYTWLKEIEPFAKKIQEHKRKMERKKEDKEDAARKERVRKAKEAYERQKKEEEERKARGGGGMSEDDDDGDFADAAGGMPGGLGDFSKLMSDPELMALFQDPEIQAAFAEISSNPANMAKHQSNPKVAAAMKKFAEKMGGGGGGCGFPSFGGGAGGGGFGGAGGPRPPPDMDVD